MGFIGASMTAQMIHLNSYREIEGCELVALAGETPKLAEATARKYGIERVYADYEEMLEREKLDGVVVSVDFRLHHKLLPEVLKSETPVLIDAPLAASPETGQRIADLADRKNFPCHMGYVRRFDPAVRVAKEMVERWRRSGECGELTYVRATMPFRNWPYGIETVEIGRPEGFGIDPEPTPEWVPPELEEEYLRFITFYINQINLLRYLLGQDLDVEYVDPRNTLVVFVSKEGITCTLEMAQYGLKNRWEEFYKICFDNGKIDLKLAAPLSREKSDVMIYNGRSGQFIRHDLPNEQAAESMASYFVSSIREGLEPLSTVEDGVNDLRIAKQYISLLTSR